MSVYIHVSIHDVGMDVTDNLQELQNIREFKTLSTREACGDFKWMLWSCRDEAELWRVILQMENLVELQINLARPVVNIPTVGNGLLSKLEKLILWFMELAQELLRCLDGAGDYGSCGLVSRTWVDLLLAVRDLPQWVKLNVAYYRPPVEKFIELRSFIKRNKMDLIIKSE